MKPIRKLRGEAAEGEKLHRKAKQVYKKKPYTLCGDAL
jgi:hypothetical protein